MTVSSTLKIVGNFCHQKGQVQTIPFYGDIQLSLYMGIFLKIDTIAAYGKGASYCLSCVSAQNRKELHDVNFLLGNERCDNATIRNNSVVR